MSSLTVKRPSTSAEFEPKAKVFIHDEAARDGFGSEVPSNSRNECSGDAEKHEDFVEQVCAVELVFSGSKQKYQCCTSSRVYLRNVLAIFTSNF